MDPSHYMGVAWLVLEQHNQAGIEHIAGRYDTSFARAGKNILQDSIPNDRYNAINYRDCTWEFRLFNSSVDFETISMRAEFCLAAVAHVKENLVEVQEYLNGRCSNHGQPSFMPFHATPLAFSSFAAYVQNNSATYPALAKHLGSMRYLPSKVITTNEEQELCDTLAPTPSATDTTSTAQ